MWTPERAFRQCKSWRIAPARLVGELLAHPHSAGHNAATAALGVVVEHHVVGSAVPLDQSQSEHGKSWDENKMEWLIHPHLFPISKVWHGVTCFTDNMLRHVTVDWVPQQFLFDPAPQCRVRSKEQIQDILCSIKCSACAANVRRSWIYLHPCHLLFPPQVVDACDIVHGMVIGN